MSCRRCSPGVGGKASSQRCRAMYRGSWMPGGGPSSYSAVMPFAIAGIALGALLLGNAAVAPDAAPLYPLDVLLVLLMVVAVAVARRFPVPALAVVTVTMLAVHVRVHAGVSAAF